MSKQTTLSLVKNNIANTRKARRENGFECLRSYLHKTLKTIHLKS